MLHSVVWYDDKWINNELEMTWKEVIMFYSRYYPSNGLNRLWKTTEDVIRAGPRFGPETSLIWNKCATHSSITISYIGFKLQHYTSSHSSHSVIAKLSLHFTITKSSHHGTEYQKNFYKLYLNEISSTIYYRQSLFKPALHNVILL